ncbi:hypothetical protein [Aeromicrobium sp. 179-A 4D2 NHS]|uniref:hypothetical protein n=1 Tax=Aeromicrobium sp. 179-A 4D2 NHS TaxID=3142375 RepID=UPI0039A108A4
MKLSSSETPGQAADRHIREFRQDNGILPADITEPTEEMIEAFKKAWEDADRHGMEGLRTEHGLRAVLELMDDQGLLGGYGREALAWRVGVQTALAHAEPRVGGVPLTIDVANPYGGEA